MNCSKTGHSYEAFTYLFGHNIFLLLLSAKKNSPVDLSNFVITGNCGLIRDSVVGLRLFISATVLLCTIVLPVFFCSTSILRAIITHEPIEWETSGFQRKFCLIAAFLINYCSLSSKFAANPQTEILLFKEWNFDQKTLSLIITFVWILHRENCVR